MTSFAYTTGNPNNLVANQNASMADIQGPFIDISTKFNNGTLDETNVPNLAAAFTSYERFIRASGRIGTATGNMLMAFSTAFSAGSASVTVASGFAYVADYMTYLDPAIYAANSRVTKLNLRVALVPGTTAPTVNYTAGLYPIATFAAANPMIGSLGTVIAGSTAAINAPPATTLSTATSGDFNFPAAGPYALVVVPSGTAAAGTNVDVVVQLEIRRV